MGNERAIPKLRFPSFNGNWESRKLGNQMYIKSRIGWQALKKNEYLSTGDYYLITGTDIDENTHTVNLNRCSYVSKERYEMDENIQVHEGDIIVTKDGTIGKVAMVSGLDKPATLNSHLFVLRDLSGKLYNRFLLQLLCSHVFTNFVESTKTGSTLTGLPQKTIIEFTFMVPNIEEQKKISSTLDNLDTLITLQQRKLDQIREYKKGMLQKMFPKEGETVPEVRFPGFTGEWERRKLRELAEFNPKSILPDSFEYVDLESVVGTEMLSHRTESKESAPSRAQRLAQKGDLFYQTVRPYQRNNYLFEKFDDNYVFSTGYAQMRPYGDGRFLLGLVQTDSFINTVLDHCTGTSYPAINSNDLADIYVYSPMDKTEQKRIGDFLTSLDTLISLHQRKLDQMKEYKKGLLQQMFV